MKTFKIKITETRETVVDVEAHSVGNAIARVSQSFADGRLQEADGIDVCTTHLTGLDFEEYKE